MKPDDVVVGMQIVSVTFEKKAGSCGFEVRVVGEACRLTPRFGCCGTDRSCGCALARSS